MKRNLFFITLVVLVAIGIYAWYLYNKPHTDLNSVSPDVILTASSLFAEYNADEVAADARFLGKIVEVTGIVESIEAREGIIPKIILATGDPLSEIQCEMAGNNVKSVNNGEELTLRCVCSGKLMDIILNKCVIIKK